MWSQAASALSLKEPFTRVKFVIGSIAPAAAPSGAAIELAADGATAHVIAGGDAVVVIEPPKVAAPAPAARIPELVANDTLDAVLDMELPLVVRFARTVMSLKSLAGLGPGSIVDMERSPDEPVQMLVGDRVIARGEVVVVGGHYGVRVTDLVSSSERARALEG
jgi:flagellar motor switch protein FliN/FliY